MLTLSHMNMSVMRCTYYLLTWSGLLVYLVLLCLVMFETLENNKTLLISTFTCESFVSQHRERGLHTMQFLR